MNEELIRVCEKIVSSDEESNRLMNCESLDELYDYFLEKVPNLTKEEFDEYVCEMLESYANGQSKGPKLDENDLEMVSGGVANFRTRLVAGVLGLLAMAPAGVGATNAQNNTEDSGTSQSISAAEKVKMKISDVFQKTKAWVKAHPRLAIGIGVGVGLAVATGTTLYVKHRRDKAKEKSKVGNVLKNKVEVKDEHVVATTGPAAPAATTPTTPAPQPQQPKSNPKGPETPGGASSEGDGSVVATTGPAAPAATTPTTPAPQPQQPKSNPKGPETPGGASSEGDGSLVAATGPAAPAATTPAQTEPQPQQPKSNPKGSETPGGASSEGSEVKKTPDVAQQTESARVEGSEDESGSGGEGAAATALPADGAAATTPGAPPPPPPPPPTESAQVEGSEEKKGSEDESGSGGKREEATTSSADGAEATTPGGAPPSALSHSGSAGLKDGAKIELSQDELILKSSLKNEAKFWGRTLSGALKKSDLGTLNEKAKHTRDVMDQYNDPRFTNLSKDEETKALLQRLESALGEYSSRKESLEQSGNVEEQREKSKEDIARQEKEKQEFITKINDSCERILNVLKAQSAEFYDDVRDSYDKYCFTLKNAEKQLQEGTSLFEKDAQETKELLEKIRKVVEDYENRVESYARINAKLCDYVQQMDKLLNDGRKDVERFNAVKKDDIRAELEAKLKKEIKDAKSLIAKFWNDKEISGVAKYVHRDIDDKAWNRREGWLDYRMYNFCLREIFAKMERKMTSDVATPFYNQGKNHLQVIEAMQDAGARPKLRNIKTTVHTDTTKRDTPAKILRKKLLEIYGSLYNHSMWLHENEINNEEAYQTAKDQLAKIGAQLGDAKAFYEETAEKDKEVEAIYKDMLEREKEYKSDCIALEAEHTNMGKYKYAKEILTCVEGVSQNADKAADRSDLAATDKSDDWATTGEKVKELIGKIKSAAGKEFWEEKEETSIKYFEDTCKRINAKMAGAFDKIFGEKTPDSGKLSEQDKLKQNIGRLEEASAKIDDILEKSKHVQKIQKILDDAKTYSGDAKWEDLKEKLVQLKESFESSKEFWEDGHFEGDCKTINGKMKDIYEKIFAKQFKEPQGDYKYILRQYRNWLPIAMKKSEQKALEDALKKFLDGLTIKEGYTSGVTKEKTARTPEEVMDLAQLLLNNPDLLEQKVGFLYGIFYEKLTKDNDMMLRAMVKAHLEPNRSSAKSFYNKLLETLKGVKWTPELHTGSQK